MFEIIGKLFSNPVGDFAKLTRRIHQARSVGESLVKKRFQAISDSFHDVKGYKDVEREFKHVAETLGGCLSSRNIAIRKRGQRILGLFLKSGVIPETGMRITMADALLRQTGRTELATIKGLLSDIPERDLRYRFYDSAKQGDLDQVVLLFMDKIPQSDRDQVFLEVARRKDMTVVNQLLKHVTQEARDAVFLEAFNQGKLEVLDRVIDFVTSETRDDILAVAVERGNVKVIDIYKRHEFLPSFHRDVAILARLKGLEKITGDDIKSFNFLPKAERHGLLRAWLKNGVAIPFLLEEQITVKDFKMVFANACKEKMYSKVSFLYWQFGRLFPLKCLGSDVKVLLNRDQLEDMVHKAFIEACKDGDSYLVSRFAKMIRRDDGLITGLKYFMKYSDDSNFERFVLLISREGTPIPRSLQETVFRHACQNNMADLVLVRYVYEDMNDQYRIGNSDKVINEEFHKACERGDIKTAGVLVKKLNHGDLPLDRAFYKSTDAKVKTFLKKQMDDHSRKLRNKGF
jgi:hypothetical protein